MNALGQSSQPQRLPRALSHSPHCAQQASDQSSQGETWFSEQGTTTGLPRRAVSRRGETCRTQRLGQHPGPVSAFAALGFLPHHKEMPYRSQTLLHITHTRCSLC